MSALFEGKEHARLYNRYRPKYKAQLYDRIYRYLNCGETGGGMRRWKLAVDVGCGSGQNTRALAPYFDEVIGLDVSDAQLEEARRVGCSGGNVRFRSGSADDLSAFLPDECVDLMTAATALHWFDVDGFCQASLRVLRPGGVLAAFAYNPRLRLDDARADRLFRQFYDETLGSYWAPQIQHLSNHYQDLFPVLQKAFPHSEKSKYSERDDSLDIQLDQSIADFCGFLSSFSAYQQYRKQNSGSPDPLHQLYEELQVIYGAEPDDKGVVTGYLHVFMILGKKQ